MSSKIIYKDLSYKIVGVLYDVYNFLGYGYREKEYEMAIIEALKEKNIEYKNQVGYKILYKNKEIGRYYLDFIIEDKIILEIKIGNYFPRQNIEQIKRYLKATGIKLAILVNFTSNGVKQYRMLNNY